MPNIPALTLASAPAASQSLLAAAEKKLGMLPNLFATIAHSPAALKFYLGQGEALAGGKLPAGLRHQIALATSGVNDCDYCASAHTLMGKGSGVAAADLAINLRGRSADARTQAALSFAKAIVEQRGHVGSAAVNTVRAAGWDDAEIVEIIANVGATAFTNLFNNAVGTVIDFPLVKALEAQAA
jgi:uncharacterized peroxidase-related enzyme